MEKMAIPLIIRSHVCSASMVSSEEIRFHRIFVFDSTLIKGVFVYYSGYSFPYQGREVLIFYSLSGPQPVAGGTCIPLMEYYLQNVVKSWCTALKSPLLGCIIDPLHENTSLFSAWYTTDSEDVSVLFVSCQLQYHLQQQKGKVGNHPQMVNQNGETVHADFSGALIVDGCQSTRQVLELVKWIRLTFQKSSSKQSGKCFKRVC